MALSNRDRIGSNWQEGLAPNTTLQGVFKRVLSPPDRSYVSELLDGMTLHRSHRVAGQSADELPAYRPARRRPA